MSAIPEASSRKSPSLQHNLFVTRVVSYALLFIFSLIMVLPLLWLLNGSMQPEWQINANPVIWIPREWLSVNAGTTHRTLNKYLLKDSSGKQIEVVQVGVRSYTTVVDTAKLTTFLSVPRSELSSPVPTLAGNLKVNERTWKKPDGTTDKVVAMARDLKNDNNLLVVPASQLAGALYQYPLDVVNQSQSGTVTISGVDLDTHVLPDGKKGVAIGPEDTFWVMSPPEIAAQGRMIQVKKLGANDFQMFGRTQLAVYPVQGQPETDRFVVMTQESWQPLLPADIVKQYGILVKTSQLSEQTNTVTVNEINMITRTYTPAGGSPQEVAVLTANPNETLVLPLNRLDTLTAAPFTGLVEPGSAEVGTITYRVKQDFENPDGSIQPMAFVGDIQDFAIVIPATSVTTVYDARPAELSRSTRLHFYLDGYVKVLNLKLQGVPFWRFFLNSLYLVVMNTIGYFLSCVLVAYGFARIRAPGKEILFVILLGTMMIPYTILTLPTFMLFHGLGLLNSMAPLWIRSFFGNAFLVFLLRQFFMSIPYDLDEAAVLDGANRFDILTKVILPLSKPALATVAIFTFWWTWNSFLDPLIFTTRQEYYTITLALNSFNRLYGAGTSGYYDRVLSGAVLALLPMVLLFIFAQRYFIEGIQMQGLKR
jgi:ABC-type glycerol-3-phosphate transport system permease component